MLEARYEQATEGWEHAFVACAQGRFAEAVELATPLLDDADPAMRAQARLTAGSALRQLGWYDRARAVERVHDLEDPVLRAHLFVSQAADAVGLGSLRVAHAALGTATTLIDEAAPGSDERRARIRAGWVGAEIALASDAPALAVEALEPSRALSVGWPRHEAKTALFEGVARRLIGESMEASMALRRAAEIATTIGADPIASIAGQILADDSGSRSSRTPGIGAP